MSETLIIVASIFGLIGLGYVAGRTKLLSADVGERLVDFVFTLAIPFLIFDTFARADFQGVSPWRIWTAFYIPFAFVWIVSHLMVVHFFGRDGRAGIVAGGSAAYSNSVLIGIPLMQTAFGDQGVVFVIVVAAIHLPILTGISVVLNEMSLVAEKKGEGEAGQKDGWRQIGWSFMTNPIFIAIAAGLMWRATGLAIPRVAAAVIEPLARSAGPLALFASGMALVNYGMARQIRPAFAISALKLLLMPALVFASALAIGLPPLGIAAITMTAACPTGVNASLIAIRLGTGQALASNVLLISTAGGVVTVALWLMAVRIMLG